MPKRVQRKRTKGWKTPEGAVYVGRPTKWGNPFSIYECGGGDYGRGAAIACFRHNLTDAQKEAARAELRGKDLMCWCPLNKPCHADVLLEIANG